MSKKEYARPQDGDAALEHSTCCLQHRGVDTLIFSEPILTVEQRMAVL